MSLELALRYVEVGIALALLQRAAEHTRHEPVLFLPQIIAAVVLIVGLWPSPAVWALWALAVLQLHRFQGAYNGGSDKMALLALSCLGLAHLAPAWADIALGYLAVQLVLSYFVSGWVKLTNPQWRSGAALTQVFRFSAYPVSENLRRLANHPRLMQSASLGVIGFEVLFPLALLHPLVLGVALVIAAGFHLLNALLFGLNRFLWIWIATYPALIWLQTRLPI